MFNLATSTRFSPRQVFITAVILGALSLPSLWYLQPWSRQAVTFYPPLSLQHYDKPALRALPQKRRNIAVASVFGFHHDVYLALVWTMQRVMMDNGKVQVYARPPYAFGFDDIVDQFGLYHGATKHPDDLISDIANDTTEGGIDMVVFGTCEIDMRHWNDALLAAWDARDSAHKFQVVCLIHHVFDSAWQSSITEWSRRNAIRFLTISEHVGKTLHTAFRERARSSDPIMYSAGYQHLHIDFHVPILDVPNISDLSPTRMLANIVVQGTLSPGRRDYARIFDELIQSLHENPSSWGYLPLGDGPAFARDTSVDDPPFQLHLAGSGTLEIPPELRDIVIIHLDLDYGQFYKLMGTMDACIPAFPPDNTYYEPQASSTVAMCMEANVPILLTQYMRDAYTYIDDEGVVITRPAVMREVHAIRALRTGTYADFLASDPSGTGITMGAHPGVEAAVTEMMRAGWVRSKQQFDEFKRGVWGRNDVVVMRMLRDL
jgi:hypothetical protein